MRNPQPTRGLLGGGHAPFSSTLLALGMQAMQLALVRAQADAPCASAPCRNSGTCVVEMSNGQMNGYSCKCPESYFGANCESLDLMDDCVKPGHNYCCAQGGNCIDGFKSTTCECKGGWSGADCATTSGATYGDAMPGQYCTDDWLTVWNAHTVKPLAECQAACTASTSCLGITVGTLQGADNNCALCTGSTVSSKDGTADWATYYAKVPGGGSKTYSNVTGSNFCANVMSSATRTFDPCAAKPCGTHTSGSGVVWDNAQSCTATGTNPNATQYGCDCNLNLDYYPTTDKKHCCEDPNTCVNGLPTFSWLDRPQITTESDGSQKLTQCKLACKCTAGFTGILCDRVATACPSDQISDPCLSSPCQNGATCVCQSALGVATYKCDCSDPSQSGMVAAFSGLQCETRNPTCTQMSQGMDQCKPSPCLNGGTCHDLCFDFKCSCTTGFQGAKCQSAVYSTDACDSKPCRNGATCVLVTPSSANQMAAYECACTDSEKVNGVNIPGKDFYGQRCELHCDECASSPCPIVGAVRQECNCIQFFGSTSTECSAHACSKATNPCLNGGSCLEDGAGASLCDCSTAAQIATKTGYGGSTCQTLLSTCGNACASTPCLNGGVCKKDGPKTCGQYECVCSANYGGPNCDKMVADPCVNSPCLNGGVCQSMVSGYSCNCAPTFQGTNCGIISAADVCASSPCAAGSTCSTVMDATNVPRYSCACPPTTIGDQCDHLQTCPTTTCASAPCLNGGTCFPTSCLVNTTAQYECTCVPANAAVTQGFNPNYNCNPLPISADEVCASSPCQNGGTCVQETGSSIYDFTQYTYSCTCPHNYFGAGCEFLDVVDDCARPDHPYCCAMGGTCVDGFHTTSCTCKTGWTGADCSTDKGQLTYSSAGAATYGAEQVGQYCSGNWGPDWDAKTVKTLAACQAACTASATCVGITVGTISDQDNNCALCTSTTLSPADWPSTYMKSGGNGANFCPNAQSQAPQAEPCAQKPCGTHTSGNGVVWDNAQSCSATTTPPAMGSYACDCNFQLDFYATTDKKHCCQDPNTCVNGIPQFTWLANASIATESDGSQHMTNCGMTCKCSDGYTGPLCDHLATACPASIIGNDPCASAPCLNGGTCVCQHDVLVPATPAYKCDCSDPASGGYSALHSGANCEARTQLCNDYGSDQCDAAPCLNGGTCVDECFDFTCTCAPGFQGTKCQNSVHDSDPCVSKPCQNGGACGVLHQPAADGRWFECICPDSDGMPGKDFFGSTCEKHCDVCETQPCQAQQAATGATQACNCLAAPANPSYLCSALACASQPCMSGGTCLEDGKGGFACSCDPMSNMGGPLCNTDVSQCTIDACAQQPCSWSATCTSNVDACGDFQCVCAAGYTGETCMVSTAKACISFPCENGGTCLNGVGNDGSAVYQCNCGSAFGGDNCADQTGPTGAPTSRAPTVLGQTWSPTGAPTTAYPTVDNCATGPCKNNGVCTSDAITFKCACTGTFAGITCESAISTNPCIDANPCLNGATCTSTRDANNYLQAVCNCATGYMGEQCGTNTTCTACPASGDNFIACQNGGTCQLCPMGDGLSVSHCACQRGYASVDCSSTVSPTATPTSTPTTTMCVDAAPYTPSAGMFCSDNWANLWAAKTLKPLAACQAACTASSTCVGITVGTQGGSDNNCVLCTGATLSPATWSTFYAKAASSGGMATTPSCLNGGVCTTGPFNFLCTCQGAWSGDTCQDPYPTLDPCVTANPCLNGGTCTSGRGTDNFWNPATCTCTSDFFGVSCESSAADADACTADCPVAPDPMALACMNGGWCLNCDIGGGIKVTKCHCPAGFVGATCDGTSTTPTQVPTPSPTSPTFKASAACASSPCLFGGTCAEIGINGNDAFSCTCAPTYFGSTCAVHDDVDYCSAPGFCCALGSNCLNVQGSGLCTCKDGYTGQTCTTRISDGKVLSTDQCTGAVVCSVDPLGMPCGGHGTCSPDGATCTCDAWANYVATADGTSCVSTATTTPDTTGSTTSSGDGGTSTPSDAVKCAATPCQNGGVCEDSAFEYHCTCVGAYAGVNCNSAYNMPNPCTTAVDGGYCKNGGACATARGDLNEWTAATCTCGSSGDYFGDTCSKKFSDSCTDGCNDPSNPDPCKNGATCKMCDIDGFGIVVVPLCKCAVGFSGDVCEVVAAAPAQPSAPPSAHGHGWMLLAPLMTISALITAYYFLVLVEKTGKNGEGSAPLGGGGNSIFDTDDLDSPGL